MTDLVGGQVQVGLDSVAATKAFIDAGKLPRLRGSLPPPRLPSLPDVPTLAEQGLPDFEVSAWTAVSPPAGDAQARSREAVRRGD